MEKNKMMMIVIIILLVLLLGTIVGVSLYALNAIGSGAEAEADNTEWSVSGPAVRLGVDEITKVPLTSAISTNLRISEDGLNHYVRINFSIGINNTNKADSNELILKLQDNEVVIRDAIYQILRNKTYEDMANTEEDSLRIIKDEIKGKLQDIFQSNLIVEIYISEIAY